MLLLGHRLLGILIISLMLFINESAFSQSLFSLRGFAVYFGEAKFGEMTCDGDEKAGLKIRIRGIGKVFDANIDLSEISPSILKMDDRTLAQMEDFPVSPFLSNCKSFQFRRSFKIDAEQLKQLQISLSAAMASCQAVSLEGDAFRCELPPVSLKGLVDRIKDHRKKLVSWSRQPYFVLRRLEVTRQLAEAVETQQDMHGVCRVIKKSLPLELPYALTDEVWQQEFCDQKEDGYKKSTALVALQLAVDELELLMKIGEKETFQSVYKFTLEAPEQIEAKGERPKYWIRFSPTEETRADFYQTVKAYQTETLAYNGVWHPIFGTKWHPTRSFDAESDVDQSGLYVWQSIACETEFLISKGYTKMLRLPQGRYTVSAYPTTEQPFQIAGQVLEKSEIEWQRGRRPTRKQLSKR